MQDLTQTFSCERSDELISFLYQELDERAAGDFKKHLANCSSCSRELASFSEIRSGVVAWREQSLGLANFPTGVILNGAEKPSALVAIRQFFALSPLWLKGAVAFASVLSFAVAVFLLMNLNAKPVAPLAANDKIYSEAELRAKVEAEIQTRLKELNAPNNAVKEDLASAPVPVPQTRPKPKSSVFSARTLRAPLTKAERQQLAADLRLISPTEEDLNLLGEQINR